MEIFCIPYVWYHHIVKPLCKTSVGGYTATKTYAIHIMIELIVVKAGTSQKGNHWAMIEKTEGVVNLKAFLSTTKALNAGDKIKLPTSIANNIEWKL